MTFALVGNQNCGKTTLFNALTGSNQHVGNFPGVTVDQKSGQIKGKKDCMVVDLPGIYSLRPYTQEEIVARDFIFNQHPQGIINIIDATNIERNLYLTLQLLELKIPMVVALNMMDEIRENHGNINVEKLSTEIGVPIIPISALKGEGIDQLIDKAIEMAQNKILPSVWDFCSNDSPVHRCIHGIVHLIDDHAQKIGLSPRFCATKIIEEDSYIVEQLKLSQNEIELLEHCVLEMEAESGLDRNSAIADMRYTFIENAVKKTVHKPGESKERLRTVKIDKILTGKFTAIPVFIAIMGLIFYLTFGPIGQNLSDLLAMGIDALSSLVDGWLTTYEINPVIHSLVIDGIFAGVGSVLSFVPIIVTLFFFLSILEDTGYMARVAFFMDKPLRKLGLSGKSFVPMLIGFGCSVPAIMSTRTLSNDKDRKLTILLVPFMSCSAKIPIYTLFCAAFFKKPVIAIILLYLTGIFTGIFVSILLKGTLYRGQSMPFVMELPNYRLPGAKNVALLLWEKARDFIEKAFTVIFLATMVIWFLQNFDARINFVPDNQENSLLALLGNLIAPIFAPLGFGNWKCVTALISGFSAKEAVVSTMSLLLASGSDNITTALREFFTTRSAISFLVFTLLYTPCVAAIGTVKKELKSTVKTIAIVVFQCVVAWIMAFLVYSIFGLF